MKWPINSQSWLILLLDSKHQGGIETHVMEMALALHNCGVPVRVCFIKYYGQDHPIAAGLKAKGIAVDYLDGGLLSLLSYLSRHKTWILHTHGYKAGVLGRLAASVSSVPSVSTFHAGEVPAGLVRAYDLLDRYTGFLASKQLAVSQEIASRIPFGEVSLVNNFINTSEVNRSSGQQIAFVGRLSVEKAADRVLALARELPNECFHLYGDGPERQTLMQSAPANVVFHGHCQMQQHWQDIGLLLMPSRYEGLPLAALEAMARGIPVVATKVGELPRVIDSGVNGFLVEGDHPGELTACVQHWLNLSADARQQMAEQACQTVAHSFSVDAVLPSMLKEYQAIA